MKKILLTVLSSLLLGAASAQTTPTPAQAQKATTVASSHVAQAQAKTTNNLSRYQRTECARQHGKIVKNAKGKLVCLKPTKKK